VSKYTFWLQTVDILCCPSFDSLHRRYKIETTGTAHKADQTLHWADIKFLSYYVNNSFRTIIDIFPCWFKFFCCTCNATPVGMLILKILVFCYTPTHGVQLERFYWGQYTTLWDATTSKSWTK